MEGNTNIMNASNRPPQNGKTKIPQVKTEKDQAAQKAQGKLAIRAPANSTRLNSLSIVPKANAKLVAHSSTMSHPAHEHVMAMPVKQKQRVVSENRPKRKNHAKQNLTQSMTSMSLADLGVVKHMLKAFCDPYSYGRVRLPTEFQSFPTVISNPFMKVPAQFADLDTPTQFIDSVAFIFRDQFRAAVVITPSNAGYLYQSPTANMTLGTTASGVKTNFPLLPLVYNAGDRVHGDALYPGILEASGRGYYWATGGDSFLITNGFTQAISADLYRFAGSEVAFVTTIACAATVTTTFTLTGGTGQGAGYYGLSFSAATTNNTGNIAVALSLANGVRPSTFGHLTLPNYHNNIAASVDSAKIYAVSAMFTNEASPLNRQGKISSLQVPNGRYWFDFTNFDEVASSTTSSTKDIVDGAYSYLKPTQPSDFNFQNDDFISAGSPATRKVLGWFKLIPDSDYLVHFAKVTNVDGKDAYWTFTWALEFRTNSVWFDTAVSTIPPRLMQQFNKLLDEMPQHFTNEFHISDIGNWIKNAAEDAYTWVKNTIPEVIKVGTTVAQVAGAIAPFL